MLCLFLRSGNIRPITRALCKNREEKQDATDRAGFSTIANNGTLLKAVGLAAFFGSLLREEEILRETLHPRVGHALCQISQVGSRKSPRDNRDFILERAIRARQSYSIYLPSFLPISISPGLFAPGRCVRAQWDVWERMECNSDDDPTNHEENELVKLWPTYENKSRIGYRECVEDLAFVWLLLRERTI